MGRVVISLILLSLISHAIPKELSCHGEMLFQYGKDSKFRLKAQHSDKAGAWASQPRMQICFDNTGGCDTIEEINRCRTGSYYRPLWQKTHSLWGLSAPVSYRKRNWNPARRGFAHYLQSAFFRNRHRKQNKRSSKKSNGVFKVIAWLALVSLFLIYAAAVGAGLYGYL